MPTAQSPKTENTATKGDCKRQFDMGGRIGLENMVMEGRGGGGWDGVILLLDIINIVIIIIFNYLEDIVEKKKEEKKKKKRRRRQTIKTTNDKRQTTNDKRRWENEVKKEQQAFFSCVPCLAYFLYLLRGRVSGIGYRTCRSAPPRHE